MKAKLVLEPPARAWVSEGVVVYRDVMDRGRERSRCALHNGVLPRAHCGRIARSSSCWLGRASIVGELFDRLWRALQGKSGTRRGPPQFGRSSRSERHVPALIARHRVVRRERIGAFEAHLRKPCLQLDPLRR